jgi:hypothetical protein
MKISAKFIGLNGSLGYKTGQTYELYVAGKYIKRLDNSGACLYDSISSFLINWTDITIIEY